MNLLGGIFSRGGIGRSGGTPFSIPVFAEGSLSEGIQKAMTRERQMSGRQPMLAVINKDEMVLTAQQAQKFQQLGGERILNFAGGKQPSSGGFAQSVAANSQSNVSVNVPISIQGDGDSGIDTQRVSQVLDAKIRRVIAEEKRPGGSLRGKGR